MLYMGWNIIVVEVLIIGLVSTTGLRVLSAFGRLSL